MHDLQYLICVTCSKKNLKYKKPGNVCSYGENEARKVFHSLLANVMELSVKQPTKGVSDQLFSSSGGLRKHTCNYGFFSLPGILYTDSGALRPDSRKCHKSLAEF